MGVRRFSSSVKPIVVALNPYQIRMMRIPDGKRNYEYDNWCSRLKNESQRCAVRSKGILTGPDGLMVVNDKSLITETDERLKKQH